MDVPLGREHHSTRSTREIRGAQFSQIGLGQPVEGIKKVARHLLAVVKMLCTVDRHTAPVHPAQGEPVD
ncbi:MAG: hypothetical protein ACRDTG_24525 [Pseudonocardiaceae bacterium]